MAYDVLQVGIPGIGTQSTGKVDGSKWQVAIAVALNNRKFEYGKQVSYTVANDSYGDSTVLANTYGAGITSGTKNENSAPTNFVQYGDKAVLGPSTVNSYEGYSESIRIASVACDHPTNSVDWTNGMMYFLDRQNKYKYQSTDPITIQGTGQSASWYARNCQLSTLGIMKGYSALNAMGRLSYAADTTNDGLTDYWEKKHEDTTFVGIKVALPVNSSYDATTNSGPTYTPSGAQTKGPAVFQSTRGLMVWRDLNVIAAGNKTKDWYRSQSTAAGGVLRYVRSQNTSNYFEAAYNTNQTQQSESGTAVNLFAPVLTGFVHEGGQYKDHAQALFTMVNGLSDSVDDSANYLSTGIYTQILSRSSSDYRDISYSKIIPQTNYRLGITWKGKISGDPVGNNKSNGSQIWAQFQWQPTLGTTSGDIDANHYSTSVISTDKLLGVSAGELDPAVEQTTWKTDMVSGAVKNVDQDDLETAANIKLDIILQAKNTAAYSNDRNKRGVEAYLLVDNVWLEHEGDISGASGNGYVEIDHYPEANTLSVKRHQPVKGSKMTLADGSTRMIDPTGSSKKFLHTIQAEFVNASQTVFNQFQELMRWQDLGYRLTLHPFLPNVPHCLVGQFTIGNVDKSFWDLTKFSFRVTFTETE